MFIRYKAKYSYSEREITEEIAEFAGIFYNSAINVCTIVLKNTTDSILLPMECEEYSMFVDTLSKCISSDEKLVVIDGTVFITNKIEDIDRSIVYQIINSCTSTTGGSRLVE